MAKQKKKKGAPSPSFSSLPSRVTRGSIVLGSLTSSLEDAMVSIGDSVLFDVVVVREKSGVARAMYVATRKRIGVYESSVVVVPAVRDSTTSEVREENCSSSSLSLEEGEVSGDSISCFEEEIVEDEEEEEDRAVGNELIEWAHETELLVMGVVKTPSDVASPLIAKERTEDVEVGERQGSFLFCCFKNQCMSPRMLS